MKKKLKILILGKGRVGEAIFYYLNKIKIAKKVAFFSQEKNIREFNLLIGALPGQIGEKSLQLALKYKKNLIDLSDLEREYYLKAEKEIERRGIVVVPGCGFCPGLVNFILGNEISKQKKVKEIEISAGTLSPKKFFFPFLWSFEDLILEHQIGSFQKISGEKIKFPAFASYQKEKFFGLEAESYFAQSGFDDLIDVLEVKNFKFRVIRPFGFFYFFQFLESQGFFKKNNLETTKTILESQKQDNLTLAEIKLASEKKKILWQIKSFSKKRELLNSMQKISAIMPSFIAQGLFKNKIKDKGLLFVEKIGQDQGLFEEILAKIKREKILIKRNEN